jgi:integrase
MVEGQTMAFKRGDRYVFEYRDATGRHLKSFKTLKEARAAEEKLKVDVRDGTHVPVTNYTVEDAAKDWYKAVELGRHDRGPAEASTLRQCRYHIDKYIAPRLGTIKLVKLSKTRVETFRDSLIEELPSRSLAKKVLASLKGILSEARRKGHVAVNAAADTKIGNGSRDKEEVVIPEVADIRAILAKLDEFSTQEDKTRAKVWRRWRAIIATAIHTGMRASEVRGLPWTAVDFKAGKIFVKQRADEKGVIGKPKSKSGYRTINISEQLVNILRERKAECPHGALAFPTGNGNPESLANIFNRAWMPVLKAARIRHFNFHTLRHFHASMLIASGANPKEVQVEMGHASIQITYDLYGHKFTDEDAEKRGRERSERMANLLA